MQANDQGRAYPTDHLEGNQECVVEGLAIMERMPVPAITANAYLTQHRRLSFFENPKACIRL